MFKEPREGKSLNQCKNMQSMASTQLRHLEDEEEAFQPASPSTEYINSSVLSLSILAIFESEIPIDDSQTAQLLRDEFLRINSRFSSILIRGEKGNQHWKKVDVRVEDHIKVPYFPEGLSPDQYDGYLQEYLTKISMDRFPDNRPLWEIHLIKYPTTKAAGIAVFKLHHALGDGFSLMGALFSCLKRADDRSLPLTFPSTVSKSRPQRETSTCRSISTVLRGFWNTAYDFIWSVLRSTLVEDDRSAIRSGTPLLEFQPAEISTITFSLDAIRQVKSKVEGVSSLRKQTPFLLSNDSIETVNDVATGMVFFGIQLYMKRTNQTSSGKRMTTVVLLNTRMVNGYQNVQDMLNADTWGNHFTFLQVSIPSCSDVEKVQPLDFVYKAKKIIRRKRNSLAIYLTSRLLQMLRKIRGKEAVSRYIYTTIKNTSTGISNLVGPMEKMVMGNHPVKNFYFIVAGVPQSLSITMVSYIGNLTLVIRAEKGFIASELLVSCMKEAFDRIYEEACGKEEIGSK